MIVSFTMGLILGVIVYLLTRIFLKEKTFQLTKCLLITFVMICIVFINYLINGINLKTIIMDVLLTLLLVIFVVDNKIMIIPDSINIGIFLLTIYCVFILKEPLYSSKKDLIGAIILNTIITIVVVGIFMTFKKEVLGLGDIKLFFAVGLLIGLFKLIIGIFIACLIATIFEVLIFRFKRRVIPFGPYLVVGFMFVIIFEKFINFHTFFSLYLR